MGTEQTEMTLSPHIPKPNRYSLPDAAHAEIDYTGFAVTILAPGPKGRSAWGKIRQPIIAVNSAPLTGAFYDVWLVADGNAPQCNWFNKIYSPSRGPRIFSEAVHQNTDAKGDYTFWFYPNVFESDEKTVEFMELPYRVDPDFFRPTESVTGIAIDFTIRYGAKEINLIGVDMAGGYFDDPPDMKRDVINDYVFKSLQKEIDYFKARGIKFHALSPTRLEL